MPQRVTEPILRTLGRTIAKLLPRDREAGMRVMQYALEEYMDGEAGAIKRPAQDEAQAAQTPAPDGQDQDQKVVILAHVREMLARRKAAPIQVAALVAASCALTAKLAALGPILLEAGQHIHLL